MTVSNNGQVINITRVDDPDFGYYTCVVHDKNTERDYVHRYGLNVNGAYFGDLFELRYKKMLITGKFVIIIFSRFYCTT